MGETSERGQAHRFRAVFLAVASEELGDRAQELGLLERKQEVPKSCIPRELSPFIVSHTFLKTVLFFLTFYFILAYGRLTSNVTIVSREQQRGSAIH